jgi:hypothetical protein
MYFQLLDDFEKLNRKNNMAAALTFAVRASLLERRAFNRAHTEPV